MDPRLPNPAAAAAYTSLPNRNIGLLGTAPLHNYSSADPQTPASLSSIPNSPPNVGQLLSSNLSNLSNLSANLSRQPPGYDLISLAKDMISSDRDNQLALVSHLLKNIVNAAVASHLALAPGYPPSQNRPVPLPNLSAPPPPLPPNMPPPPPNALPNGYTQGRGGGYTGNNGYNTQTPGNTGRFPAVSKAYTGGGPQLSQPPPRYQINGTTGTTGNKRVVSRVLYHITLHQVQ